MLRDYIIKYVYQWGEEERRWAEEDAGQISVYVNYNKYPSIKRYDPSQWGYARRPKGQATGQLLHSIMSERIHSDMQNYIAYMIFSNPERMQVLYDASLHGTRSSKQDYSAVLLERLNEAKDDWEGGARVRWWRNRPPFFDMYIQELDRRVYTQFQIELRKIGMNVLFYGQTFSNGQFGAFAGISGHDDEWDF